MTGWALPLSTYGSVSVAPRPGRSTFTAAVWTHQLDGRRCSASRTAPTPTEAVQRLREHLRSLGLTDARGGASAGAQWPVEVAA